MKFFSFWLYVQWIYDTLPRQNAKYFWINLTLNLLHIHKNYYKLLTKLAQNRTDYRNNLPKNTVGLFCLPDETSAYKTMIESKINTDLQIVMLVPYWMNLKEKRKKERINKM